MSQNHFPNKIQYEPVWKEIASLAECSGGTAKLRVQGTFNVASMLFVLSFVSKEHSMLLQCYSFRASCPGNIQCCFNVVRLKLRVQGKFNIVSMLFVERLCTSAIREGQIQTTWFSRGKFVCSFELHRKRRQFL